MQIQLIRKGSVNAVLVGTLALGIGSLNLQPAAAQMSRSAFREAARELNLSRAQMRDVAGIMRSFKSDVEDILSPEQVELIQSAREQYQAQPQPEAQANQDLRDTLNLTDTQSEQLAVIREETVAELQEVLDPNQLEQIMEMTAFSQL